MSKARDPTLLVHGCLFPKSYSNFIGFDPSPILKKVIHGFHFQIHHGPRLCPAIDHGASLAGPAAGATLTAALAGGAQFRGFLRSRCASPRADGWWHVHQAQLRWKSYGCVWKCRVPLNPMVLLIIIPFLNGYHWEYTQHFQTHPHRIPMESWPLRFGPLILGSWTWNVASNLNLVGKSPVKVDHWLIKMWVFRSNV